MTFSSVLKRKKTMTLVAFMLLTVGLYQFWLMWPSLVIASIQWQREVNAQLADILYEAKASPFTAGSYLIGFSFLYGMLHSLGPGHGKVIVTTYLATHPTKAKTSLVLTIVSAFVQAMVAIVLVSVLVWGFSASMRAVNEKAMLFVSLSFALVVVLGGLICWKSIKQILQAMRAQKPASLHMMSFRAIQSNEKTNGNKGLVAKSGDNAPALLKVKTRHSTDSHIHNESCGCGHQHVPGADAINRASTWREYVGIIASIGIRPCTGAIMVLLFANVAGLYWMGVLSAIVMAVGTAFTTSIIALMTLSGKHLVKHYLTSGSSKNNSRFKLIGYYVQLSCGVLLVLIGFVLMSGHNAGMSPIFSV